ncbi:MAG: hypothetical protein AAGG68_15530 [Bacteroidota bacterium]
MKPFQINLINGIVLIAMGLWGYFSAGEDASPTAFIPVAFGALFLIATPLFKKGNKVVVHIVVLLTFLLIFALSMPLKGRMEAEDTVGIARVGIMMATCAIAMVFYVKSFIDARKARQAG